MLALITNDDGIKADGIQALISSARKVFSRVVVVAPRSQKSATSHAITINKAFRIFQRYGDDAYGLEASPADCVFFGLRELLDEKPDFVLSGVNLGPNLGFDTIYSGTVAAAREGLMAGIKSLSFSLAVTRPVPFDQAQPHLERVLRCAVDGPFPEGRMVNVNIPALETFGGTQGYRVCGLGKRVFANQTAVWKDPQGIDHGWIGGKDFSLRGDENSDCHWVKKGYVTMTPLSWNLASTEFADISSWEQRLNREAAASSEG